MFSYSLNNHEAHQIHAEIWDRVGFPPRESHKRALFSACVLYPRDKSLALQSCRCFPQNDESQNALDVLFHYHRNSREESSREETMQRIQRITADMNS